MDGTEHNTSEPPTPAPANPELLQIRVKDDKGLELVIRVKKSTKMERIRKVYCDRSGRDIKSVRLVFDGVRVLDEHTPESLDMEDLDIIDVFEQQIGGGI